MFYLDRLFPRMRLPDRINWDLMFADNRTMYTKVGGFLQVAHVIAPDMGAASGSTIDTHYDKIAALEARLDDGWTILHDQLRWLKDANLKLCDYGGNVAAQMIDAAERRQFAGDKAFDNALFIAIHYEPDRTAGLMEYLAHDPKAFSRSAEVRRFKDDAAKFFGALALIMPKVDVLEGKALGSYLSQTVNYEATPAELPPIVIDEALGSSHWVTGINPTINYRNIRTVELYSIGSLTADTARMLHELPFECRWTVRIDTTAKHRQTKWLSKMRAEAEQRRQTIFRRMVQHFTRREEPDSNPAAGMQVAEADQLRADVVLGDESFAPITMTVRVWHEDKDIADERAFKVEVDLKNLDFRAEKARISAVTSILADIPGNDPHPREVLAKFSQIVRLSPLTGISRGEAEDGKWDGPALMLGYSERGVPVRLAFHGPGEKNGNMAIIGQSRGGKSVLAARIAAGALKYENSKVIVFDIGRAFMPTCLCLGGSWLEPGTTDTAVVQPLRHVDKPDQALIIHDWLRRVLEHQGIENNHETDHALASAMSLLATQLTIEQRTMSAFVERIGASSEVREALRAFTKPPLKSLFDGVVDSYGSSRVIGIEFGSIRMASILPLLVSAIFNAIRYDRLRDGSPGIVIFDEFHEFLKRETFADEADRIAREIAKHNGVVIFATQHPADMTETMASVIKAQCPTLILTPDPDVLEENQARFYRALGCSEDELMALASGYQKAQYFVKSRQYRAMLTVRLADEAEAICCRTTPRDIQHCHQLLADGIAPGPEFLDAWFRHVGFEPTTREEAA